MLHASNALIASKLPDESDFKQNGFWSIGFVDLLVFIRLIIVGERPKLLLISVIELST